MKNLDDLHSPRPQSARFEVTGGTMTARVVGDGPTLLFVHALMVNGHVWSDMIPNLAPDYRMVMLDLALGAHHVPLNEDADCSLPAHAARVVEVARQLDGPIALIGNDTGGAIAQLAVTQAPQLFDRLVLLPCDAYDNCPPKLIGYVKHLPKIPGAVRFVVGALRAEPLARLLMKSVAASRLSRERLDTLLGDLRSNPGIRGDLEKLLVHLRPEVTLEVAARLPEYEAPVGILWSRGDIFFPVEHAHRLAETFPDAQLEVISEGRTLLALDQPDAVVDFIRAFVPR